MERRRQVAAALSGAVFVALALLVWLSPEPTGLEAAAVDWAREHEPVRPSASFYFWASVMFFGDWALSLVVFGLAGLGLLIRNRMRLGAMVLGFAVALPLLVHALKVAIGRPRPETGTETAFPSGHATAIVVLCFLAWGIVSSTRGGVPDRTVRAFALGIGAALSILVGVGRVVTLQHWPLDVIGGWALGAAYGAFAFELITRASTNKASDNTVTARSKRI